VKNGGGGVSVAEMAVRDCIGASAKIGGVSGVSCNHV
jgi:hypothetical protein